VAWELVGLAMGQVAGGGVMEYGGRVGGGGVHLGIGIGIGASAGRKEGDMGRGGRSGQIGGGGKWETGGLGS
jgi:hypothetical protein